MVPEVSGFHFPGGRVKDDSALKDDLKAILGKKYQADDSDSFPDDPDPGL
jgi:hypothetical protein